MIVTDYSVDAGLVKELPQMLKQLAQEVGQWGTLEIDPSNSQILVTFAERSDGPQ